MKIVQKQLLLSAAITATLSLNVHAQDSRFDHSLKLGFEGGYYDYAESTVQKPKFMENEGGLYGAFGEYKLHVNDMHAFLPDALMLESNIKGGTVDYTSDGTGSRDGDGQFLAEARVLLGKEFQATYAMKLTPFLGFGYRYLNDENSKKRTSTGHSDYERESNYWYVPVGVKMNTEINQDWNLDVAAEYDIFIEGEQKTHLSDVRPYWPNVVNQQNNGYGVRASIDLVKKTHSVGFLVGTYMHWWDIGNSDFVYGGYEPKNQTIETGIRVGLTF